MSDKTAGVIIKQSDFGEGHRMLWIFTEKFGIVKAVAHGAEKTKSKNGASTQFLSYCDFEFFDNGDVWNIKSVSPKDNFWPVQEDIKKLALCTYFADLIYFSLDLHNADNNILRLFLNCLYACAYKNVDLTLVKLVFETKLMYFSGMLPPPTQCLGCGSEENLCYFNKRSGGVNCKECSGKNDIYIGEDAYKAHFLIVLCHMKKMFSYLIEPQVINKLAPIIESYTLSCMDRQINSLDYYKALI